ncbi:MAG: nucleotidyl transferase AbiEii/AbiGii toxin family protein [Xanthomonadales bacterium]|nr:nucleotidyl transferase AbiEii/AbiGii toxin family protein [Xanthomonadales bacterium]
MTATFRPRLDVLPVPQRRLWPELAALKEGGFVLYGGTAVAVRLGHRQSVDFDFFTDRALQRDRLYRKLPALARAEVLQDRPDTLTVLVGAEGAQVKLSFFGGIGFGRVGEPALSEDGVLVAASLLDLMGTKLKALLQRVEAKDYLDIAAMLQAGVPLPLGLAAARQLYGPAFQPSEALKALVWFQGGDLETLQGSTRHVLAGAAAAVRDLPDVSLRAQSLAPDPVE